MGSHMAGLDRGHGQEATTMAAGERRIGALECYYRRRRIVQAASKVHVGVDASLAQLVLPRARASVGAVASQA